MFYQVMKTVTALNRVRPFRLDISYNPQHIFLLLVRLIDRARERGLHSPNIAVFCGFVLQ